MGANLRAAIATRWRSSVWVAAGRMVALLVLAAMWQGGATQIAFPFGGGEAHWVMRHVRPLGMREGLFVGGLYTAAGVSFAVLLAAKRVWVVALTGMTVAGVMGEAATALTGGTTASSDWPAWEWFQVLGIEALPLCMVGVLVVACRTRLSWPAAWAIAWWPAYVHLLGYAHAAWLPSRFRAGALVACVTGGATVGAITRRRR